MAKPSKKNKKSDKKTAKPVGRPSSFSVAIADLILNRLANGEALSTICKDEKLPCTATVFNWLADADHAEFLEKYTRARESQAEKLFGEMLEIADTPCEGIVTTMKPTGPEIKTGDMIEHRRLQVETRKWAASKLAPKKYGDKLDLNHSGEVVNKLPDEIVEALEAVKQRRLASDSALRDVATNGAPKTDNPKR